MVEDHEVRLRFLAQVRDLVDFAPARIERRIGRRAPAGDAADDGRAGGSDQRFELGQTRVDPLRSDREPDDDGALAAGRAF